MNELILTVLLVGAGVTIGTIVTRRLVANSRLILVGTIAALDQKAESIDCTDFSGDIELSAETQSERTASLLTFGGIIAGFIGAAFFPDMAFATIAIGISAGYIGGRVIINSAAPDEEKGVLLNLPMTLEKLLIAIQSGLDVVPALQVVSTTPELPNPASRAFQQVVLLIEGGAAVEAALEQVASASRSIPLKHVLLHLKVAHSRGGDLTFPLRELADATQVTYEQTIEEEIAVMPIKATAPLLCTFLGLLIIFLTGPIIGVVTAAQSEKIDGSQTHPRLNSSGDKS